MACRTTNTSSESSLSPPPDHINVPAAADEAEVDVTAQSTVSGRKRKAETTVKTSRTRPVAPEEKSSDTQGPSRQAEGARPNKRARKVKTEELVEVETHMDDGTNVIKVVTTQKRQRKKKAEDTASLADRSTGSKLRVGAHVSIAGGVHNSVANVLHIGANAFALFLKNQRKWDSPKLDPGHAKLFIDGCKSHDIHVGECCLPHGSYLVNLAHPDDDRKKQAYDSFHDDLSRCHQLGIKLYNFHPGNSSATTKDNGIRLIADAINKAHKDPKTGKVIPLLETMATLGNTIGGAFEDLARIIELVDEKDRVGVCLDTCHVFAAGYDLRTPEAYGETMAKFDEVIGLRYLKALHMNDSKAPLASNRDLHARIGTGYLGLRSFHNIVNDERLHGLPMVLETPIDRINENGKKVEDKGVWAREIKMLESLVGMNVESEQFKKWEKDLHGEGSGERERIGGQVRRKQDKIATPKKQRGKKQAANEDEGDSS